MRQGALARCIFTGREKSMMTELTMTRYELVRKLTIELADVRRELHNIELCAEQLKTCILVDDEETISR
jgi:hypothetical protein